VKFSKKQLLVLTWWTKISAERNRDAIICDGAVRSGKTFCMGLSFVLWTFYAHAEKAFAMVGKTIKSIKRNLVTPILETLSGIGIKIKMNLNENKITMRYGGKTNIFYLFVGKDESSATLIQGLSLAGVFFDEVALMPETFVKQAMARCSDEDSKLWFSCNPEGPVHWFYREWICAAEDRNALLIKFTMRDNPMISEKVIKRYENIFSGVFYERFILGKWCGTHGLVYPFMTSPNAFEYVPEALSEFALSCDYGIVNPTSIGLWGKSNETWYRIDEYYYDSRIEGKCKTDEEHYFSIEKLAAGKNVNFIVIDPSAASMAELIRRKGRFKVISAKNEVAEGISLVSAALKSDRIKICKNCVDSIREFSLYRWKENGCDAPIKENDHAMDDIRYFVSILEHNRNGLFALSVRRGH
jgi:PBSX family phage terminase large subunit